MATTLLSPLRIFARVGGRKRCRSVSTLTIPSQILQQYNHGTVRVYPTHWRRHYFSTESTDESTSKSKEDNTVRLSKLLSQHTQRLAVSRREAERLIKFGDVTVAGQVITSPHFLLNWGDLLPTIDRPGLIKVSGKAVALETPSQDKSSSTDNKDRRVWAVHKLRGEVVADFDPQGRPSMMERLVQSGVGKKGKKQRSHIKSIGRLDMTTEGLILVTTCGQYAREMELPSTQIHRTYRVRVHGLLTRYKVEAIQRGIRIDGKGGTVTRYGPMKVDMKAPKGRGRQRSTNTWLTITCTEGKNRQIRNVLQHLGCKCRY